MFKYPALVILVSFLSAICLGTLLLLLPPMTTEGNSTDFLGGLFISTSAVCVTGLSVYDVSTHFSIWGQLVILFLIQIGGLGIMTISTGLAIMLGQRFSIRNERLINLTISQKQTFNLFSLVKKIVLMAFIMEGIGAILLFFSFISKYPTLSEAMYVSIFHSISAFCNAGFSLFSDSLMGFSSNLAIILPVMFLIISGGLGFNVVNDLYGIKFKVFTRFRDLSFHSKIVISATLVLLVAGTFVYFLSEYNATMQGMNLANRLTSAAFFSTTTRTAGFNTLDTAGISNSSLVLSCLLMFIGASPGSTGGGIKTTTFAIIILAVISFLQGRRDVTVFSRKISDETMIKVLAMIAISTFFLFFIIFLLLVVEKNLDFRHIIFEAFSAFGTVGLSMGITDILAPFSRVLIILLMFIGRVGPLTFVFALAANITQRKYSVPEEQLDIG